MRYSGRKQHMPIPHPVRLCLRGMRKLEGTKNIVEMRGRMKINKETLLLYAVTDRSWLGNRELADEVEEVIKAGVTLLQLRDKELPIKDLIREAQRIRNITRRYRIPLIINDKVEAAIASDADGVHLGQEDDDIRYIRRLLGRDKIIGITAHNVEEAVRAEQGGADYIGVGAVFGSHTKKDAKPLTVEQLKEICSSVSIPVTAIGGITRDNIMQLAGTGVDGVAVISAIFARSDKTKATLELLQLAKKVVRTKG